MPRETVRNRECSCWGAGVGGAGKPNKVWISLAMMGPVKPKLGGFVGEGGENQLIK